MRGRHVNIYLTLVVLAMLMLAVAGCGGGKQTGKGGETTGTTGGTETTPTTQEVITLKLADTFPVTHPMHNVTKEAFIKKLEDSGRIKVDYYPASQLGKEQDMLELVKNGSVDIAYFSAGFLAGQLPLSTVVSLPGLFENTQEGAEVYWQLVQGVLADEFAKQGVVPIWVSQTPSYEIFTKDKQVKRPDDIKGMKIRGGGGEADVTLQVIGATPVSLPSNAIYESFQRGVIDGVSISYVSGHSYRSDELAKYGTEGVNLGSLATVHGFNAAKWEALPDDVKQIIQDASQEAMRAAAEMWANEDEKCKQLFKDQGGTIYTLTPEDKAAWQEAYSGAGEGWVKRLEEKGFSSAKQVYDEMQRLIAEGRK